MKDYAKHVNSDKWLRHPAMGDPSFDTFEKKGDTVHVSKAPYEWAVNGSLYEDTDGTWYLYAGLYGWGYAGDAPSHAEIYRSTDKGATWENIGDALKLGFVFEGWPGPQCSCPDVVLHFDPHTGKYLLAFDGSSEGSNWENAYVGADMVDSGAGVALGDSPAGPFTPVKKAVVSNNELRGKYGRFIRFYATTVIPRKNDYLALVLCDSGENYAWGLAGATAGSLDEGFCNPTMLLCADREDYYPAPMEFYPCFVHDGKVYAPATSVCANRNYQFMFAADLESAHDPKAWKMVFDGNVWHARPLPDEHYGIWGQTINGFVDKTGNFTVMYPSRDTRGYGTLSVATRPWDVPVSDGFTLSGHVCESLTLLRDAYSEFTLEMDFSLHGAFEVVFGFDGVLGASDATSDCRVNDSALRDHQSVRISGCEWAIKDHGTIIESGSVENAITSMCVKRENDALALMTGETFICRVPMPRACCAPIGLLVDKFSNLECSVFRVEGCPQPAVFRYNVYDALLGGGWGTVNFRSENNAFVGNKRVKWNAYGTGFSLKGICGPKYGSADVVVDGVKLANVSFFSETTTEKTVYTSQIMPAGGHGIALIPVDGDIPVPVLEIKQ